VARDSTYIRTWVERAHPVRVTRDRGAGDARLHDGCATRVSHHPMRYDLPDSEHGVGRSQHAVHENRRAIRRDADLLEAVLGFPVVQSDGVILRDIFT